MHLFSREATVEITVIQATIACPNT